MSSTVSCSRHAASPRGGARLPSRPPRRASLVAASRARPVVRRERLAGPTRRLSVGLCFRTCLYGTATCQNNCDALCVRILRGLYYENFQVTRITCYMYSLIPSDQRNACAVRGATKQTSSVRRDVRFGEERIRNLSSFSRRVLVSNMITNKYKYKWHSLRPPPPLDLHWLRRLSLAARRTHLRRRFSFRPAGLAGR